MKISITVGFPLALVLLGPAFLSAQSGEAVLPPGSESGEAWEHIHQGPYAEAHIRLERQLRCNCGCLLDVHLCQKQMQCGTSPVWSQRILRELEEGRSEEVILAGFVADFGESVRMLPPMEGFNWVGYLLPWMAIATAAGSLILFFRRRSLAGAASLPAGDPDLAPEDLERIQEELERMEELERDSGF